MKLINVLATGPSLKRFKPSDEIRIGVNKIVMSHYVDHLIVVDVLASFRPEVQKKFRLGNYGQFYTHLPNEWKGTVPTKMNHIHLHHIRGEVDLDTDRYCYSISSPFVAVSLAFKLGATLIDLYGADYNDHPSFKSSESIERIKKDFRAFQDAIKPRGCSLRVTPESVLAEFLPLIPKSRLKDVS